MNTMNVNSSMDNRFIQNNTNNLQNNSNPLDLQKNFLNLLIAQIKNQDPTDPIKNTELTSQLAQINTATGVERLNNTVLNISSQMHKNYNIQVSSLIGHHVMMPRNYILHTKGKNTKFGVELVEQATSLKIQIKNKEGDIVYTKNMNNMNPGIYHFIWNGKDTNENNTETGKYDISISAKNHDQNVLAQSLSEALVHNIITSSEDPILDLGVLGNITLSQIREILK